MLRPRPPRLLGCGSHLGRSPLSQPRRYAMRGPPNPEHVNYPLLSKLYNEYLEYSKGNERNVHKIKAFGKAISALNSLPFQVQRIQDVEKIAGIGPGIKRRIEEVLVDQEERGNIPSTSENINDKKELLQAMGLFQTISGIGPQRAKILAERGFRTLDDVMADKEAFSKLPHAIQTSMTYSSKTLDRIQRQDIDNLASMISDTLKDFAIYITGSYRRGAPSSSDVDVLVFHKDYQTTHQGLRPGSKKAQQKARDESPLLAKVVPLLTKANILKEVLASGPTKWRGLARVHPDSEKICRIDLNLMPMASQGAALIASTGDAEFNLYLRGKAVRLGMKLNELGLWKRPLGWGPLQSAEGKGNDENWELVPTETEEAVFEKLKEGWVDPEKRNFNNLHGRKRRKSDF